MPDKLKSPYFSGLDITDFLEDWDYTCESYGVSDSTKYKAFPRYVEPTLREEVKTLPGYACGYDSYNEDKFYKELRKLYKMDDIA